MNTVNKLSKLFLVAVSAFLMSACGESNTDELVIYSGRSQALVDDLVSDFEEQTGADVEIRYGNDAELLAVMGEEGEQSPADVFWANTTGAIANASQQDMLVALPDSLTGKPDAYTTSSREWVPVTVRFRVLAYNPQEVDPQDLPESVLDLPDMDTFEGRVGWTPTYSSFYDFMTTLRLVEGEDAARSWLRDMQNMEPKAYSSNTPMVQAIAAGEIDIALTNHYYVLRMLQGGAEGEFEDHEHYGEQGPNPDATIATYHFNNGDVGNTALVTGAAQLQMTENEELAQQFLGFLLSRHVQEFAAQSVHEYPVIRDVDLPKYMLSEEEAFELSPDYDYEQLRQLEGTLNLLREEGLI